MEWVWEKTYEDTSTGMDIGRTTPYPYPFFTMLKKEFQFNVFLGTSLKYTFLVKLHPIIYLISHFLNFRLPKYVIFHSHLMFKCIVSLNMCSILVLVLFPIYTRIKPANLQNLMGTGVSFQYPMGIVTSVSVTFENEDGCRYNSTHPEPAPLPSLSETFCH